MKDDSLIVIVVLLIGINGCVKYAPLPLTDAAVSRALAPLDRPALRERLTELRNPLIRGTELDPAAPLTPGSASVLAVVANPSLRAARDRAVLSDAQLLQARVLPNPSLSYSLDVPFGSNSRGEAVGYGLGLDWEITSLISRGAKIDAARAASDQVGLDIAWKEWQVAQAARQAVYDVVALRAKQADAEQLADRLGRIADNADAALRRHDLTANDASAANAAAGEARVSLAGIRRDLHDAELALNQAIGASASTDVAIGDNVSLPDKLDVADAGVFLANLETRRIDLVALRRGYDSQESSLRAAVLSQFPKISLGISQTRDTGDFLTIGPSFAIDLPFFDRNQGNIAIERATRQELFDEYITRVFEARSDVARAVAMIHSLNEVIAAQSAQVASLRELVAANEKAMNGGNLDVATFYGAAVSLSQKQSDLTTLKQDLIHAWISLELATGASLNESEAAISPTTAEVKK